MAHSVRPEWLRVTAPGGVNYRDLKRLVSSHHLHTVCESARCPNIGECWERRTATFMILGNTCTRNCAFCAVPTGRPTEYDTEEPERVAAAVVRLGLRHAVITSVTRDDLADGGASIFAATIQAIRRQAPRCSVEVLIPDFKGSREALQVVMDARPTILNHNLETVASLQRSVRPQADYQRSLAVLRMAREMAPDALTKSGIMLGLGEEWDEILETMADLRSVECNILTLGQYLRPSLDHLPIRRYYTPEEFETLREKGLAMGFTHVEAAPLVRSSYHAAEQAEAPLGGR
ncbi:MAG TPA: lipoyl synthase [Armatimonadota bacterium]|nr:lipoyl synthase [Armatimonadota bacterium]HOJ21610.1 lipoyl synthase [Armatimonadota bacterium]HOM82877.1 lipoyl synthase [Armatimonadota bacterium]HPO71736.1 lipoyl synthase [Armatimonadota bacterium]HPT96337.1 lipoyl synthase [Armatimonadota bacterium]